MSNQVMKRFLSILLALVLVLNVGPVPSLVVDALYNEETVPVLQLQTSADEEDADKQEEIPDGEQKETEDTTDVPAQKQESDEDTSVNDEQKLSKAPEQSDLLLDKKAPYEGRDVYDNGSENGLLYNVLFKICKMT